MIRPLVSLIAVLSENRVIGNDGKIPWHISEEIKRFKKLTTGHPVIMGRITFASIGKPLPDRTNIIVTRKANFFADGCNVVHSFTEALDFARTLDHQEIFVIGGASIYEQALKYADKLYLTIIKGNFTGDAYFPEYSEFNRMLFKEEKKSEKLEYTFVELIRG